MMSSLSRWGQTHFWIHRTQLNVELDQDNSGAHNFQEFPLVENEIYSRCHLELRKIR